MKRIALNATEEEERGVEDAPCRKENYTQEAFTIAVLGGGAAGKSSLVRRFLYGVYEETGAAPTLYDEYTGRVPFEGAECAFVVVVSLHLLLLFADDEQSFLLKATLRFWTRRAKNSTLNTEKKR
ncbi:hypothetical protein QOT17_010846 [Balamuthia mandrillaris]